MKKQVIKVIVITVLGILLLELGAYFFLQRPAETKSFQDMDSAAFPIVQLKGEGGSYSELHGFAEEMQIDSIRNSITPLNENREATLVINTYGKKIDGIQYQVRSVDGSRLIDDVKAEDYTEEGETVTLPLKLTNLLEANTEYTMVILLNTEGHILRYFNRIIYGKDMHIQEMIDYIHNFSDSTFDKKAAESTVVNVIQPDKTLKNDDFNYVDLHSSFKMLTWGALAPVRTGEPQLSITDLNSSQMAVTLTYPVSITSGEFAKEYDIEESFCVRYRNGKVLMLDYERRMKQQFDLDETAIQNNDSILLGISDGKCQIKNSEEKNITAFVYGGQLWSYNAETGIFSRIFSLEDSKEGARQVDYGNADIKIIAIKDNGDMDFVVYGYRERGREEGTVGISTYRYFTEENYVEELFNIPVNISEKILQKEFGNLFYLNESDVFYFQCGRSLYAYDIGAKKLKEIVTLDSAEAYFISRDSNVIAWEEKKENEKENQLASKIRVLNADTGHIASKQAEDGEYFIVKGFINTDLVYGAGREKDLVRESGVITSYPLYAVDVMDAIDDMEIINHYQKDGIYITEIGVEESRIVLQRVQKKEDNSYIKASQDILLLNEREDAKKQDKKAGTNSTQKMETKKSSKLISGASEPVKKEYYIKLGEISTKEILIQPQTPQFLVQKDYTDLELKNTFTGEDSYYVYGFGGETFACYTMKDAVQNAYDTRGAVLSNTHQYLWKRVLRAVEKKLDFEPVKAETESETLKAVIQMVAKYEKAEDPGNSISNADGSVLERLQELLPYKVLNLYGCNLADVLYYVNLDSPVIAIMGNGSARMITGYNNTTVTVYDPLKGESVDMAMDEAKGVFEGAENSFISYVK